MASLSSTSRFLPRVPIRIPLATAGISAFVLLILFAGMSRMILSTRQHFEEILTDLTLLEQKQRAAFAFADMTKRRKSDIDRIQALFIDPDRPLNFIEHMEDVGRRTGTKVTLGADARKEGESGIVFHITAEGSEHSLRRLLALVETSPFALRLERVGFQRIETPAAGGAGIPEASSRIAIALRVSTR